MQSWSGHSLSWLLQWLSTLYTILPQWAVGFILQRLCFPWSPSILHPLLCTPGCLFSPSISSLWQTSRLLATPHSIRIPIFKAAPAGLPHLHSLCYSLSLTPFCIFLSSCVLLSRSFLKEVLLMNVRTHSLCEPT